MDWHELSGIVSGLILIGAVLPYLRDMLKGTTRPNLVTWFLWTLIQAIVVAAQLRSGASWSVITPAFGVAATGSVLVLGLFGYGYREYTKFDWACLVCSLSAIVLWILTSNPLIAIYFSILADFCASLPTLAKAWKDPKSESFMTYFLAFVSGLFGIVSTEIFNLANTIWLAYILLINAGIVCTGLVSRRRLASK